MDRWLYRRYRQNLHNGHRRPPRAPQRPPRDTPLDWFTAAPIRLLAWYLTIRK